MGVRPPGGPRRDRARRSQRRTLTCELLSGTERGLFAGGSRRHVEGDKGEGRGVGPGIRSPFAAGSPVGPSAPLSVEGQHWRPRRGAGSVDVRLRLSVSAAEQAGVLF